MTDDRTLDAARVTELLRPRYPGVDVADVEVLGQHDGSASRLRIAVSYAPGCDVGLPATIFVKRNLPVFNFPGEMYSTEVRVYRDILPGLPIEKPAVYAIDASDDNLTFTILMEDLGGRPGARLGIVTEPVTADEVAGLLETIATVHGSYWANDRLARELSWLQTAPDHSAMQFWRKIGPKLGKRHRERGHRAPMMADSPWTDDTLWSAFDRFLVHLNDGPHTLVHGDVHAGNVYYAGGGPGGLLDWQLSLRGSWALDVTYLLTTALDPDQQVAHERDLVAHYLDALRSTGAHAPSFDQAWMAYRRHAVFGVVMWLVTPDGVHTDEAQLGYLGRSLAAADRLGTLAALAD